MTYDTYFNKIEEYNNSYPAFNSEGIKFNLGDYGDVDYITTIYKKVVNHFGTSDIEYDVSGNDNYLFMTKMEDQDVYYIFCKKCDKLICVWINNWDWSEEELCYLDKHYKCTF